MIHSWWSRKSLRRRLWSFLIDYQRNQFIQRYDKGQQAISLLPFQSADKVQNCISGFKWIYENRSLIWFLLLLIFCTQGIKPKSSGLPDSNVIFFVATKKTKQKKAWRCAWHVVLESFYQPFSGNQIFNAYASPVVDEALLNLYHSGILGMQVITSPPTESPDGRPPWNGPDSRTPQPVKATDVWRTYMPSARRRRFCILLPPGKSMALGGARTAGSAFSLSKDKLKKINDPLLSDWKTQFKIRKKDKPYMRVRVGFVNNLKGQQAISLLPFYFLSILFWVRFLHGKDYVYCIKLRNT